MPHVGYRIGAPDVCWSWQGSLDDGGYGQVFDRRRQCVTKAHRVVWEYCRGPIPDGLELDHLCRNRRCVNVDHLELVTHTENMRRARLTHCRRGHPYTLENSTYYTKRSGLRWRVCRICVRLRRGAA